MAELVFIDIRQVPHRTNKSERVSSLSISERFPNVLNVMGGLEHGTHIVPNTQADADKLRAWLDKHYPRIDR